MTQMVLGGYTFAMNPYKATLPHAERLSTFAPTLGGAEFFSWGTTIKGKVISLAWDYMPTSQWAQIVTLLTNDAEIVFSPSTSYSYNVEILRLNGEYFEDNSESAEFRRDVMLELVIMSEV